MTPAEIVWRARTAITLPVEWVRSKVPPAVPAPNWAPLCATSYPVRLHASGKPFERIHIFDSEFPLGFEFDWHRDYRSARRVDRSFAGVLNIRDTAVVGDIKYVWELSRHQYLSALAFSANAEQHTGYIVRSIQSWLCDNPYLRGVHWASSLEMAVRIISWALLYPRIADHVARERDFRRRWLESIYLHLNRIARNLSLYSSANNHLIGELVGLYVGATCFDFWPECEAWRRSACQLLEREIRRQVGEDGVDLEQAMSYQLFTFELFLLAYTIARNTGNPFSDQYAQRLRAMAHFLHMAATSTGDLPWFGDSDEARGFLLSEGETALEVSTQLAGLLFHERAWLRFSTHPTQAARALVPDLLPQLTPPAQSSPTQSELFGVAGLACARTHDGSVGLMIDFGTLGYGSTAAHGHADALSIWLSIGDEYFLVDAGTYAYHSYPEWRTYFRSTAAHNTARVDGGDQSEITGRFLWGAKAFTRLLRFEERSEHLVIEAEHNGYERLADPVIHRRTVTFNRRTGDVRIEDRFQGAAQHQIELFFHMHEDAGILGVTNGETRVAWHGKMVTFSSPQRNARWDIVSGSENPKLGWRSHALNEKTPIPTLRIRMDIMGSGTFLTHLEVTS